MAFPEPTIQAFKTVVLAHMKNLDPDYWLAMQPDYGPEEVCTCYLSESSCPPSWFDTNGEAVAIGEVVGQPVYFNLGRGMYYYLDPESLEALDIIITGKLDFYPAPE